jgi:protein Tex
MRVPLGQYIIKLKLFTNNSLWKSQNQNIQNIQIIAPISLYLPIMKTQEFYIDFISNALGISKQQVKAALNLFEEGATIPFVARYRKEVTNNLDEVQLSDIQKWNKKLIEIEARKETILASIEEQGKLTPELRKKIEQSYDLNEIEDLYLPYKRRRKTRGDIAKEKGLEPFAKIIYDQKETKIFVIAEKFLSDQVQSIQDAFDGAKDIIAEWVSEDDQLRESLRSTFRKSAIITSKVVKAKAEEATLYKDYFEFNEPINKCPSHRYLAMMRGEKEGFLRVIVDIEMEPAIFNIEKKHIQSNGESASIISEAILDSYKRLIIPSVENQIRTEYKEKADAEAIAVFVENLRQLLLAAPLGQKNVLAIDPGFRTGCKVVCIDAKGDLVHNTNIYPHEPQRQVQQAKDLIKDLVYEYQIDAIAIGNGTASRETKSVVDAIGLDKKINVFVVSENGASIYSASDLAREEFPDKDVTVRGAISIGRRLMDPLAELVKIDPKSIGVGQYQHDVDQSMLKDSLDSTVMSCVNSVGVNLNTASKHLLNYVSGLGPTMAQNIVNFRTENGPFTSRQQLLKVPRLGAKSFEQAAGFLRIREADNLLDNTGVHPESYSIVNTMSKDLGVTIDKLIEDKELRKSIKLANYTTDKIGLPTLQDIMKELEKPGLDPRGEAKVFSFAEGISKMEDLREGMVLPGIVTNMTNFGAFVDIGIKGDAMLHISQITRKFIKSPSEVLKLQQAVNVKILIIDKERKRVNLTMLF